MEVNDNNVTTKDIKKQKNVTKENYLHTENFAWIGLVSSALTAIYTLTQIISYMVGFNYNNKMIQIFVLVILTIVGIYNIVYLSFAKRKIISLKESNNLLENNVEALLQPKEHFLHNFQHNLRDITYTADNYNSENKLTAEFVDYLIKDCCSETVNNLSSYLTKDTNERISACVKLICDHPTSNISNNTLGSTLGYDKINFSSMKYQEVCRCNNTVSERKGRFSEKSKLSGEQAMIDIIQSNKQHFFCDNLQKKYKTGTYQNQNKDWQKYYNSTIVVPIRIKTTYLSYIDKGFKEPFDTLGFLCVDTKNSDILKEEHIEVCKSFADSLFSKIEQLRQLKATLEKNSNTKEQKEILENEEKENKLSEIGNQITDIKTIFEQETNVQKDEIQQQGKILSEIGNQITDIKTIFEQETNVQKDEIQQQGKILSEIGDQITDIKTIFEQETNVQKDEIQQQGRILSEIGNQITDFKTIFNSDKLKKLEFESKEKETEK